MDVASSTPFDSPVCPSSDPSHFELSGLESLMCPNNGPQYSFPLTDKTNQSPLMEEIWALSELVDSTRVDLIQSSMLVDYMKDSLGKVGLAKNLHIKWVGLHGRNLRFVCVYDSFLIAL